MFTIADIVDLAVQIEKNGERVYRNAAKKVPDSAFSSMLLRLADEELKHAKWFSEFMEGAAKTAAGDPQLEKMGKRLLQNTFGDQTFSLKDVNFSSLKDIKGLFEVAIEFQRDTVLFYEMMRSFVDEHETLHHLNTIIEEENSHIHLLQDLLERGIGETE
jgi:rubrerythrin